MVSKVASGSAAQTAWVGDSRAVRSLTKTTQELADYIRDKQRLRLEETREERRRKFDDDRDYLPEERRDEYWLDAESERHRDLEAATRVVLEVRQRRWDLETSGAPEAILDEIDDPGDVQSIELRLAGRFGSDVGAYSLRVELGERGARAYFGGPEAGFVDMAGRRLTDQLKLQRPWYWWFRARWSILMFVIPVGIVGAFLGNYILNLGTETFTAMLVQFSFQAVFIAGPYWLLQKLSIPFELTREGSKGRTSRVFRIFGSIVAWVAASIIIPVTLMFLNPIAPEQSPSPSPTSTSAP